MVTNIKKLVKTILLKFIDTYISNKLIIVHGKNKVKTLYLTFDDGPDEIYTKKILEILKEHNIVATFFLIGDKIERNIDMVETILENDCEIGNHSYRHQRFYDMPLAIQLKEVEQTNKVLKAIDGNNNYYFRAPQGKINPILMILLLTKKIGYAYWSYDSLDYKLNDPKKIVSRFKINQVKNGDILLFHDDNKQTVEAITELIPYWKSCGFSFGTLGNI